MKKFYFLISLFVIFFIFTAAPVKVNADLLYSDSISGTVGQAWNPAGWSVHAGQAVFGTDGALGLFDYSKDFTTNNVIIRFDFNIHDAKTNLVFACRATDDYSSVEQPQFTGNGIVNSLHTSNMTQCINNSCNGTGTVNPYTYSQSVGKHTIELDCLGDTAVLKYDNQVLTTAFMDPGVNGYAVRLYSSGNNNSLDSISNLEVCDSNGCPSNTPTPTPTLPPVHLTVPLVKQTANPWQSQVYDSANSWAPNSPTINSWGCALTSAAMVLQYNGITKMPNNSDLNPGTLNTWLKSQPDGYISNYGGNGLLNWIALQRFSQIAKLAFNNPSFSADALEFRRIGSADTTTLTQDLQNNQPDILEEPNHFVVATGTDGTTFSINDPYFNRNTLNNGYGNTFSNLIRFIPSHTDLSYVLLVGPANVDFHVQNTLGSTVGEEFTQQPIENPANPSLLSGIPVKMLYISQPENNTYSLTVTNTGNGVYKAKAYLYDQSGNVQTFDITGSGTESNPDIFALTFSKVDSHQDKVTKSSIFDVILNDINHFYQQNDIKKNNYNDLLKEISEAQKQYNMHHTLQEKIGLAEILIKLIIWNNDHHDLSDNAYQTLVSDVSYLLTH